jgi:hypothetical protein
MFPLLLKERARERIYIKIPPHPNLLPKGEGTFHY